MLDKHSTNRDTSLVPQRRQFQIFSWGWFPIHKLQQKIGRALPDAPTTMLCHHGGPSCQVTTRSPSSSKLLRVRCFVTTTGNITTTSSIRSQTKDNKAFLTCLDAITAHLRGDVPGVSSCLLATGGEPMFEYRCCCSRHPWELGDKARVPWFN